MMLFSDLLNGQKILPIIQTSSVDEGVQIAKAMQEGGLTLVEVVLRSEASLSAISAIKDQVPGLLVGAGTITDSAVLKQAIDAGADFIVTPAISTRLLDALSSCKVPVLPGVSNTADILLAKEFGFTQMKFFPANLSGGAAFIKGVSSVFPTVSFCPTGGINADNRRDYLALNNVLAVGGTWVCQPQWLENKQWQHISQACKEANS
ncbi:MAG: bifunctional 4-hydroxy-2-oxoglutarate aldolase/2-dehydro-3-deoxy-phosphogluconate aldolase [Pseudoalteromonas prydzensis]|uniref:bifunctional 4-hydroxy-2-oxoglutarate aldolase/2-dehydro-3-deoxy-phosphogluconate aldolase n=1 Tax=Pseudoalteromonas prydzensis TaxID=182141 RepID=UPI003F988955